MKQKHKSKYREKPLFKSSDYCSKCQQKKSCGVLDLEKKYCCGCYRKILEELEWEESLVDSSQQLLNDYRQRVIICHCWETERPRVKYLNSDGSGWTECRRCEKIIGSAGHHGIVKNRNNPNFWGLESQWGVLCLKCVGEKFYRKLSGEKRKTYQKYLKRGYV